MAFMKRISYIKFLLPAMILAQSCKIAGDGRATRGAGKEQQLWEIFDINGSEGVAAIIQLLPYYLIPILALFLILSVRKNVRQKAKIASLEKELEKRRNSSGETLTNSKARPAVRRQSEPESQLPKRLPKKRAPGPVLQTFYSPPPQADTFFDRRVSETFVSKKHVYRIQITSPQEANYDLVQDSSSRTLALNMPDRFIIPAMLVKGQGALQGAQRVHTQAGRLVREGSNWRIVEKAIIWYS